LGWRLEGTSQKHWLTTFRIATERKQTLKCGALAAWALAFATFVAVKYGCASLFEFGQTPFSVYTGAELVVSAGV